VRAIPHRSIKSDPRSWCVHQVWAGLCPVVWDYRCLRPKDVPSGTGVRGTVLVGLCVRSYELDDCPVARGGPRVTLTGGA
jgi:hypothetical protein